MQRIDLHEICLFFCSLHSMSCGLKLWGNKSQEVIFSPSTEGLAFLHFWEPHRFHCERGCFYSLNPQNILLRISQVQSHILHLETDKTRMREECQTQHHRVPQHVQSDFLFFDYIVSEEAVMTKKEAISRNHCDFKADDLTLDSAQLLS